MRGSLTNSHATVLEVLAPGGFLTVVQLARDAEITLHRARSAVSRLRSQGLIVAGCCNGRYAITDRGRGQVR